MNPEKSFQESRYMINLRKKYNVPFSIINKEEIKKIEPLLAPILSEGYRFIEMKVLQNLL